MAPPQGLIAGKVLRLILDNLMLEDLNGRTWKMSHRDKGLIIMPYKAPTILQSKVMRQVFMSRLGDIDDLYYSFKSFFHYTKHYI